MLDGDGLAHMSGRGFDGSTYQPAASIRFNVDGAPGPGDMPSRISFLTTPDGSSTRMTRMTIKNNGSVGIGTTDPQSALQVSGYTQLDLTSGAPPAADRDEASERGRMKVDNAAGLPFICIDSGWVAK